MDLAVIELVCFRRYLRAIFHLRPRRAISGATLSVGDERIALHVEPMDGFLLLTADALISGIANAHEAVLTVLPIDGDEIIFAELVAHNLAEHDAFHVLARKVGSHIDPHLAGWDVLEVGSRLRDDTQSTWSLRERSKSYTGFDIVPGPNVDIIGDAHCLSALVGDRQYDFVYSQFVFEHLAMPWIVASELNRVMRMGAEAFLVSNQSIAMHDLPWDFFRFSDSAWRAMFNPQTGFKVIEAALGEAVRLTPIRYHHGFIDHEGGAGFQASAVWVRKVAEKPLTWPIAAAPVLESLGKAYPLQIADSERSP